MALTTASGGSLVFDDVDMDGVVIAFYPYKPEDREGGQWLWWTGAVTPEVIDEVLKLIAGHRLKVEAIVIGGLERYPLFLDGWPRWFVRWSDGDAVGRIVIDTEGLGGEERRRLVELTRRRRRLSRYVDPVTKALDAIKRLLDGRLR